MIDRIRDLDRSRIEYELMLVMVGGCCCCGGRSGGFSKMVATETNNMVIKVVMEDVGWW